jgi:hypothetical protein
MIKTHLMHRAPKIVQLAAARSTNLLSSKGDSAGATFILLIGA